MTTNSPVSVVLVDDHALYRVGVRSVIEALSPTVEIIAECPSGAEFYALLEINIIPDLVLLDIFLPDTTGIEIAHFLKRKYPEMKVIMLSSEVSEESVSQLLEIGVEGYLSKLAQMSDLEKAIRTVLGGNHYYGQSIAKIMYDVYVAKKHDAKPKKNIFIRKDEQILTNREIEIVRLLCDGYQAKEVAEKLNTSVRTIETHKTNVLRKLGFNNIAEVIKYAVKNGIVDWV